MGLAVVLPRSAERALPCQAPSPQSSLANSHAPPENESRVCKRAYSQDLSSDPKMRLPPSQVAGRSVAPDAWPAGSTANQVVPRSEKPPHRFSLNRADSELRSSWGHLFEKFSS